MKGPFRERTQVRSPEASQASGAMGPETQRDPAERQGCRRENGKGRGRLGSPGSSGYPPEALGKSQTSLKKDLLEAGRGRAGWA